MNLPDEIESQPGALTVEWLAKTLNVSRKLLYKQIARGKLPYFRVGSRIRLNPKAIAEWLQRRMSD